MERKGWKEYSLGDGGNSGNCTGMGDGIQVQSSFHTDVKDLEYKDLLTRTFTQVHCVMFVDTETTTQECVCISMT